MKAKRLCDICCKKVGRGGVQLDGLEGPEIFHLYGAPCLEEEEVEYFKERLREEHAYIVICRKCWDTKHHANGLARNLAFYRTLMSYMIETAEYLKEQELEAEAEEEAEDK